MSSQISAEKQIVLVVGGSQGIGLGLVERALNGTGASWINKDALVIATGRDPTTAEELLKLQSEYKDRLYLEAVDVSSAESINTFVATINAKYPRLDVLLYNAGVVLDNSGQEYAKLDQDIYIKTHIINVVGPQHIFFGLSNLLNKTHELLGGTVC
jgi:NAD(P)-dependent dehydrogenase (short-subunit alcohol dehydrogenase family)